MNKTALNRKIRNLAVEFGFHDGVLARLIANLIVVKVLTIHFDDHAELTVKGGTRILLSLPAGQVRATRDLDISIEAFKDEIVGSFQTLVGRSWRAFKVVSVIRQSTPRPLSVPNAYLVDQFKIKIDFANSYWATCILDVSLNELRIESSYEDADISKDVLEILASLGFDELADVVLVSQEYQLAQKIHACTEPQSRRGHDLYDINLLIENRQVDFLKLRQFLYRTFDFRKTHKLTPIFEPSNDFYLAYKAQTRFVENSIDFHEAAEELRGVLSLMCASAQVCARDMS